MKRKFLLFLSVVVLQMVGCALAPGYRMAEVDNAVSVEYGKGTAEKKVDIVPITPKLVAQQITAQGIDRNSMNKPYQIGANDVLAITVWDHPELTEVAGSQSPNGALERVVDANGTIYFPYVGVFNVKGKTIAQVREYLASKLSKYLENVQVDVTITKYRSKPIYVVGEVRDPTSHYMNKGVVTLSEALALAGGVNPVTANTNKIYVIRGGKNNPRIYKLNGSSPIALNLANTFPLEPNDVVYVGTAGVTKWNRVFSQLWPSAGVVDSARGVVGK